jgi:hypothetical protein
MSKNKSYLVLLASFLWLFGGIMLFEVANPTPESTLADVIGWGMLLGFAALFLAATAIWAGAKGYSPLVGLIMGLFGPLGLMALIFIPDKPK